MRCMKKTPEMAFWLLADRFQQRFKSCPRCICERIFFEITRLDPFMIIMISPENNFGVQSKRANIEKTKNLQLALWNLWSPLLDGDQFTRHDLKSAFFFCLSSKCFINGFA